MIGLVMKWNKDLSELFISKERKRQRLIKKTPAGPLLDFLQTPPPAPNTPIAQLPILAVDFETTGLDCNKNQILSIGCVAIENQQVKLASCYHQVVNVEGKLQNDNVLIHQITDDVKAKGKPLENVLAELFKLLAGKAMLVHYASIEKHFLAKACQQLYGVVPDYPMIDTFMLAKKSKDLSGQPYAPASLRLAALRQEYHLPEHFGHNALNDAIATAELFLAQMAHRKETLVLKDLANSN